MTDIVHARAVGAKPANSLAWAAMIAFTLIVASAYAAVPVVLRARDPNLVLTLFTDDFYYYARIARNTLAGEFSSFDRLTATNGYHPLWLLVLVALGAIAGSGFAMLAGVYVIAAALSVWSMFEARRLLEQCGASQAESALGAIVFQIVYLHLARGGMEVIIAVPLAVFALRRALRWIAAPTFVHALWAALSAAFAILARLELALLFAIVAAAIMVEARHHNALGAAMVKRGTWLAIALGSTPIGLWIAVSLVLTGHAEPTSSAAKQLVPFPAASWGFLFEAMTFLRVGGVFDRIAGVLLWIWIVAAIAGRWPDGFAPATRIVGRSAMLFVPVFYLTVGLLSAWHLWPWYFYPLVLATPFMLLRLTAAFARCAPLWRWPPIVAGAAALGVLFAASGAHVWQLWRQGDPFGRVRMALAQDFADFAARNPGRFAIGDLAGMAAYLIPHPVLQLEGLVGEHKLLLHIKAGDDLLTVLHEYRIDYYAIFGAVDRQGECFMLAEPKKEQAGDASPRMTALLCAQPVHIGLLNGREVVFIFHVAR